MSSIKLKEDLSNCLINFDRRVLITELLEDYKLAYEEVEKILQNYLVEQEKKDKIKFEKRYLIHGLQNSELKKEIYQIVEETRLKEWLEKLQNAQSCLYSVEVAGGAKAAPSIFKPMKVEDCEMAKTRQTSKLSAANGVVETSTTSGNKEEVKQDKSNFKKESPQKPLKSTEEISVKKTSPKTDTSPTDKKLTDKKSTVKKGINNFFIPTTAVSKKTDNTKDSKTSTANIKPTSPKKMQDFFKKQAEKPKSKTTESVENSAANTSVQLFQEEEEEPEELSSDEEEKLEALKRDIISSDVEVEEDENDATTTTIKRRRILDSDDEDDPPIKLEKLDIKLEAKEQEAIEETYLDEDGFVITKKPKQKSTLTTKKSPTAQKLPPVTMKNSPNETKKSSTSLIKDTKAATKLTVKTKQAGIKNFFSKK